MTQRLEADVDAQWSQRLSQRRPLRRGAREAELKQASGGNTLFPVREPGAAAAANCVIRRRSGNQTVRAGDTD